MESFVKFLYDLLGQFFGGIWRAISGLILGLYDLVNIPAYAKLIEEYNAGFGVGGWIFAIVSLVVLAAILVALIIILVVVIKKRIDSKNKIKNQVALVEEVGKLNNQVIRLTKEKDRILAIKAGAPDLPFLDYGMGSNGEEGHDADSVLKDGESRFYKLTKVDADYAEYDKEAEVFNNDITLEEICDQFRNFACSRMGLYYEPRVIRLFLAAFSSTRLILLPQEPTVMIPRILGTRPQMIFPDTANLVTSLLIPIGNRHPMLT